MKSVKERIQEFEDAMNYTRYVPTKVEGYSVFKVVNNDIPVNFFVEKQSLNLFQQNRYDEIIKTFCKIPELKKVMEENKVVLQMGYFDSKADVNLDKAGQALIRIDLEQCNTKKVLVDCLLFEFCNIMNFEKLDIFFGAIMDVIPDKYTYALFYEFVEFESTKIYNKIVENNLSRLTMLLSEDAIQGIDMTYSQNFYEDWLNQNMLSPDYIQTCMDKAERDDTSSSFSEIRYAYRVPSSHAGRYREQFESVREDLDEGKIKEIILTKGVTKVTELFNSFESTLSGWKVEYKEILAKLLVNLESLDCFIGSYQQILGDLQGENIEAHAD